MRSARALLGAAALWALATGCGATVLLEGRYESDCVSAGQCRPAYFGDVCSGCACANGAVNEQGKVRYDLERERIQCPPPDTACKCSAVLTACVDGKCVLQ